MTEHAVVIAGGGPAGMMLAAELALAEIDVAVIERRPDHGLDGSRAGGLHSRTIEVFDQRGVADRFLAEGQVAQVMTLATTQLDISDFPTRHPYVLGIWQNEIERIMAAWIAELPVRIEYATEVTGFAQDDGGVDVVLSDGRSLRARYLVGCDGGRSLIRKAAGIEFPGMGSDEEQPDRRGRDGRGAGVRRPPRRDRHPRPQQAELRDRRRRDRLRGRRADSGPSDRAGGRSDERSDVERSQRGADRRLRHRFRRPQPDLDLAGSPT